MFIKKIEGFKYSDYTNKQDEIVHEKLADIHILIQQKVCTVCRSDVELLYYIMVCSHIYSTYIQYVRTYKPNKYGQAMT
jgi:hypothetical protein